MEKYGLIDFEKVIKQLPSLIEKFNKTCKKHETIGKIISIDTVLLDSKNLITIVTDDSIGYDIDVKKGIITISEISSENLEDFVFDDDFELDLDEDETF